MLLNEFLKYLKLEKRYSSHTVKAYQIDLTQFQDYLEETYESVLQKAKHPMVRSWLAQKLDYSITPRSVNRKITTLKSFYKFLLKEEEIKEDPTIKIVSPKMSKKIPSFVEEAQMRKLLDELDFVDDYAGVRDKLILELFYSTGIRQAELINLKIKDIDIIEINEAFAAQGLASLRSLGIEDDDDRVNPNGGAIALGHPLGMSGTRLVLTATQELIEKNLKYALCTMCVGVGQGSAHIIEKV